MERGPLAHQDLLSLGIKEKSSRFMRLRILCRAVVFRQRDSGVLETFKLG